MSKHLAVYQQAPTPHELRDLVDKLTYRPGWTVRLYDHLDRGQGSMGMTLDIITHGYDSYHPDRGEYYQVHHYFAVPPASYSRGSWQRWLFQQFLLVEQHECMEFFIVDGERPYSPNHGPGEDPYTVREVTTDEARRTRFTGQVVEP